MFCFVGKIASSVLCPEGLFIIRVVNVRAVPRVLDEYVLRL